MKFPHTCAEMQEQELLCYDLHHKIKKKAAEAALI